MQGLRLAVNTKPVPHAQVDSLSAIGYSMSIDNAVEIHFCE